MTHLTVEELVLLAQRGDREAYGELVRRFEPAVFAAARDKVCDPDEAKELAHLAFVRGMTKLNQIREPAAFVGWIRQIAVRLAINRLTRKRLVQADERMLKKTKDKGHGPVEAAERAEKRAAVRAALKKLKRGDREILEAFYFKGVSIRAIAEALNVPEGTVKRRLHVARARLKGKLEDGRGPRPHVVTMAG